jgi:hypothetical protein
MQTKFLSAAVSFVSLVLHKNVVSGQITVSGGILLQAVTYTLKK